MSMAALFIQCQTFHSISEVILYSRTGPGETAFTVWPYPSVILHNQFFVSSVSIKTLEVGNIMSFECDSCV